MDNFSMVRILNMMLKSYEIVYIFVTPSPPLTRRYLISENVDNSGRPLTGNDNIFFSRLGINLCRAIGPLF